MQVAGNQNRLRLQFSPAEGSWLRNILKSVHDNYQIKPAALDAKTASAWYSIRGCQSAGMKPAEIQDWLENLFQVRGETLQALSGWLRQLKPAKAKRCQLDLPLDQAPQFLRVLNDHRLLLAARHDLGEAEMGLHFVEALAKLPARQEAARLQVDFLAHIMETLLSHLPQSGADWRGLCLDPEMD